MRPVRRTPLLQVVAVVAVCLALGRLVPPLTVRAGGTVPLVSWVAAFLLVLAAAVIGGLAWSTWKSLHRDRRSIQSRHGLRLLALAKASIAAGGVITGFYGGYAWAYLDDWSIEFGRDRVLHGGAVAIAGVLVVIAGLLLERACVLPEDDEDEKGRKTGRPQGNPEPGLNRKG